MRRNIPSMVAGVILVILLGLYAITYQVRFTELAIKTTFGKPADPNTCDPNEAGLKFKWPWPIQGVVKYDKRIQILDSPEEQAQTQDRRILILTVFCGWRIADGVAFLQKVETVREAENLLRKHLRSTIGATVGQHRFGDFVSTDPKELKLAGIEDEIKTGVAGEASRYGIAIETLGIRRISLPETTTEKVFGQMRAQRLAMAQKTRSEGEAIARRTRSKAESIKQQILSFAERKAKQIQSEGAAAAAAEWKVFQQDEDFANFLRELQFLREVTKVRSAFFLDADMLGVRMLKENRAILGEPNDVMPKTEAAMKKGPPKAKDAEAGGKATSEDLRKAVIQEPTK